MSSPVSRGAEDGDESPTPWIATVKRSGATRNASDPKPNSPESQQKSAFYQNFNLSAPNSIRSRMIVLRFRVFNVCRALRGKPPESTSVAVARSIGVKRRKAPSANARRSAASKRSTVWSCVAGSKDRSASEIFCPPRFRVVLKPASAVLRTMEVNQ